MNHRDQAHHGQQTYVARGSAAPKKDNTADDYDFSAMRANLGQKKKDAARAQGAVKVGRPADQPIQIVQPHCGGASPPPAARPAGSPPAQAASGFVDPITQRQASADRNPMKDDHDFANLRANLGKKQSASQKAQSQVYIGKPTTSLS